MFSAGGFKAVSETSPPQATVKTATSDDKEHSPERPSSSVFSCPQEGCIKVFQRSSALERHLSLEACSMSPERHTLIDLAKQQYATLLSEGVALLPSLQFSGSVSNSNQSQSLKEGWALKETKKPYRFNEKQKAYLEAKFNIGQSTGRKVDPDKVAKEMRRARGTDGKRLFGVSEFLTPQQVSSFFSRLATKLRQQQIDVTPQDALAHQFLRGKSKCSFHSTHPPPYCR